MAIVLPSRNHQRPVQTDPVIAAEQAADPRRLLVSALYREEGRLRLLLLGDRHAAPAMLRRSAVEAALRAEGSAR